MKKLVENFVDRVAAVGIRPEEAARHIFFGYPPTGKTRPVTYLKFIRGDDSTEKTYGFFRPEWTS